MTTDTITPKDERDIAAYWGAPCSAKFLDSNPEADIPPFVYKEWKGVVGGSLVDLAKHARDLKITLRSLSSLTDEELMNVAKFAHPGPAIVKIARVFDQLIYPKHYNFRYDDGHNVSVFTENIFCVVINSGWRHFAHNGSVAAYLQSVGIYLPGTIDEKYVTLI